MTVDSDRTELLDAARALLLDELLDELPESRRYAARMIARAMAIASREHDESLDDEELAMFDGLYGAEAIEQAGADRAERLVALNRRFAKDIRDGAFDGACGQAVRAVLELQVRGRLALSNPAYPETFDEA